MTVVVLEVVLVKVAVYLVMAVAMSEVVIVVVAV